MTTKHTPSRRVVALAADAVELDEIAEALRGMALRGDRVVLMWRDGEPSARLRQFKGRRPVRPAVPRRPRALLRVARSGSPRRLLADRGTLLGALRLDPLAQRELEQADALVVVGPEAEKVAAEGRAPVAAPPLVTAEELSRWAELAGTWRDVESWLDDPDTLGREEGRTLLDRVELVGGLERPARQEALARLVEVLLGRNEHALALRAAHLLEVDGDEDPDRLALSRGLRALAGTAASGEGDPDLGAAVAGVVASADRALEADDLEAAADRATLALRLLFHRELHADALTSPLVEDPDTFLAAWRGSRVGSLLASPTPQTPRLERVREGARRHTGARPRVVVAPGTFPQFSPPVVAALEEVADVTVLPLNARPELRWLGTSRPLVDRRLRQAVGAPVPPDLVLREELEAADALFVDWADRGALETVMTAPEGLPVTVRIHSMDALSPWIHLIDWSRVGDLVLVSPHLRTLVERLLGDRLATTRVHVVPNVLQPERIPTHKTEGHRRRLLVVGWGQRVKDPLFALEVLAALRAQDPAWRLSLVGADFLLHPVESTLAYAREFWARLVREDVRDSVDLVAWTDDLAPHLAASGFILSTSRRESFGLGLVEGAASGAVPVVRDWPVFASLGGARSLFPEDWVVDSVEAAVARIHGLAEEPAWSQASAAARQVVQERFATGTTQESFRRIVLG
ncbi:glycosyltransferase [Ornithinimicrobium tianjinense]|uniref:Glycosyl transferases group 1 n=1 Tax=Ornithinimicrobium tianjinense TaxID=1195761 RepID=A0A917BSJ8_9MICO|nr:glycosyltransferase [Ornithinimicrobium tianjinense]GGF52878.1 hypothetical protein GCM10011366_20850 [Ornithinimicrobium tianjinense]